MDEEMETNAMEEKENLPRMSPIKQESLLNNDNNAAPSSSGSTTAPLQPRMLTISLKAKNPDRPNPTTSLDKEPSTDDAKNFASQLSIMLSNMYLNAPERVRLSSLPRCARDISYCHKYHYRSPMPDAPNHSQAYALRCALQQERYLTFVNSAADMCLRNEFPGDGVFAKLIELMLSLNPVKELNPRTVEGLRKAIELFYLLVRTFPPCWVELRQYYLRFLKNSLDKTKISTKHSSAYTRSDSVFEIILDLLEHTLQYCDAGEIPTSYFNLSQESESILNTPGGSESNCLYFNQYEYEQQENRVNTFASMTPALRLERLFTVLRMILEILEHDFVMWIWHHHKKNREGIFASNESPLAISIMEMSLTVRVSRITKRVFKLFSSLVQKNLKYDYIKTLERYIALIMLSSNIADIDVTVLGIEFPCLGSETERLISNFYSIFKEENTTNFGNYITVSDTLRIPFVRFEFIHNLLKSFGFSIDGEFNPRKVLMDISKKRWQTFRSNSMRGTGDNNNNKNLDNADESDDEFFNSAHRSVDEDDDELTREQYLYLLLEALKAYSDWYGLHRIVRFITLNERIAPMKNISDSVHRWPTRGSTDGVLLLKEIAKNINQLEQKLRVKARLTPPRVDLPPAEILIDNKVLQQYRTDLKYCYLTSSEIARQARLYPAVDFTEWQKFLKQFQPVDR